MIQHLARGPPSPRTVASPVLQDPLLPHLHSIRTPALARVLGPSPSAPAVPYVPVAPASSTSQGNLQHDGAAVAITVEVAALAFVHQVQVSLVVLPVKALIPVGELEVVHLQSKSAFVSTHLEIISFASLYWSASEIFWLRCSATSPGSISTKIPVLSPLLSSSLKSTISRFSTMQVTS